MKSVKVTLNPTPYTLHPKPYTLHPTPYTLPQPANFIFVEVLTARVGCINASVRHRNSASCKAQYT
ncbi:MAG: hypothetical protein F6K58_22655 [Symploca sp. SIO2E9]|nr:hypothetical protein [Symploca sp. SIO2E9]